MNKEELYDKCGNMEQLYDKYYLPLLEENKQLKKINEEHRILNGELRKENKELENKINEVINYLKSLMNGEAFKLNRDETAFEGLTKTECARNETVLSMLKTEIILRILEKGE